eukprot:CAMPEP_0194335266 /NCGR_PEP_ID=MMETSP0171-20130528/68942_1 /TAXON_ID=218684 /ORGANISM="Corethron pennatum, Strain L29A3" /LENGTH=83 /DNA_ID=CAMNT_0039098257 /DNA_START=136 /DNA_END=388 /DNA_ORIENTATION=-
MFLYQATPSSPNALLLDVEILVARPPEHVQVGAGDRPAGDLDAFCKSVLVQVAAAAVKDDGDVTAIGSHGFAVVSIAEEKPLH